MLPPEPWKGNVFCLVRYDRVPRFHVRAEKKKSLYTAHIPVTACQKPQGWSWLQSSFSVNVKLYKRKRGKTKSVYWQWLLGWPSPSSYQSGSDSSRVVLTISQIMLYNKQNKHLKPFNISSQGMSREKKIPQACMVGLENTLSTFCAVPQSFAVASVGTCFFWIIEHNSGSDYTC